MIGKNYPQEATYWSNPVNDGFGGTTYDTPEIIKVRWEERQDEFLDDQGEKRISRAVVFVSQELELGAFLMLGDHSDAVPVTLDDAWRIKKLITIPDIRNAMNERRALL